MKRMSNRMRQRQPHAGVGIGTRRDLAAERAQRFGLLGALTGIGTMIGPAIGGLLAAIDLRLPVFLTAAVGLTIAVLSIFLLPESLRPENRIARIALHDVQPLGVFRTAFGRPELRGLMIAFALLALPFGFFVNNFSVLAHPR